MIETISADASISIHLLGNDIGCEHRHRYDVEHKAVHRFKSGYINTSCTNFRLAHQHLVVPDIQQTVAFYEQIFGAAKVEEVQVTMPLVYLHLWRRSVGVGRNHSRAADARDVGGGGFRRCGGGAEDALGGVLGASLSTLANSA